MIKFDIEVQQQIILFGLDDSSPNAMLPKIHGGQYGDTPLEWRKDVVSLAGSMLAAGIVTPLSGMEGYQVKSAEEVRGLLQEGDSENGFDVDLVWDVMHLSGTQKLRELLRMFELDSWEAMHSGLSQSLGQVLAEMDVVQL